MLVSDLLDPKVEVDWGRLPVGDQEPTHSLVPRAQFTHGHDAIELAGICGYKLYDFQRQGLIEKLGANLVLALDGSWREKWAAQETADVLSRRNGKSVEIEVLILTALFLLGEQKIMYTAHRDDTAKLIFDNVVAAIKRVPKLWAELVDAGPRRTNGQRAIELRSGAVCYFRTRTLDTARGQGYDRLILDEDQELTDGYMAALMPLVSGAENGQINYAGSAGGLKATVQAKTWRSFKAKERGLCYRGWHAESEAEYDDLDLVARLNPRLGRGLSYEWVAKEFKKMTRAEFGGERLGVARYPREEGADWVIPEVAWTRAKDEDSQPASGARLAFVLEADPELENAAIGVAGRRSDGAMHIEATDVDPGVFWLVGRSKELQLKHGQPMWLDPDGPLGFMVGDFREAGVDLRFLNAQDLVSSSSWLYTAANPQPDPADPGAGKPKPTVCHRGGLKLTQALAAAETRKLLSRWTWRREVPSGVDQTPLNAVTLAAWVVVKLERSAPPPPPSRSASGSSTHRPNPHHRHTSSWDSTDLATAQF